MCNACYVEDKKGPDPGHVAAPNIIASVQACVRGWTLKRDTRSNMWSMLKYDGLFGLDSMSTRLQRSRIGTDLGKYCGLLKQQSRICNEGFDRRQGMTRR